LKKIIILIIISVFLLSGCDALSKTVITMPEETSKNTVVDNPPINEITNEISEKLVGKYIAENDSGAYFEILPDGKFELSVNALSGYAKYDEESVQITAYYQEDTRVVISFRLISGNYTFPGSFLSYDFEGEPDFNSFRSMTYRFSENLDFVKQT